jgi:acetyltransferase-like isoleucine patch superfamily enzyme
MNSPSPPRPAHFDDPFAILFRAITKLYTWWLAGIYPFAARGRNLSIYPPCALDRRLAHRVRLGSHIVIRPHVWLNVLPDEGTTIKIVIEDNCVLGGRDVLSAKNCIHIERDVIMAKSVLIQDHNHAYEDVELPIRDQGVTHGGSIRIGEGSWIGQCAAIICSRGKLEIGRHCVIAANSVVTRSTPPFSVVAGNPARVIRQYDPAKKAWVIGSVQIREPQLSAESIAVHS